MKRNVFLFEKCLLLILFLFFGRTICHSATAASDRGVIELDEQIPSIFHEYVAGISYDLLGAIKPDISFVIISDNIIRIKLSFEVTDTLRQDDFQINVVPDFLPAFHWSPHLTPTDEYIIAQHVFRSPALIVSDDWKQLVLVPDLGIMQMATPVPWYMDMDAINNKMTLGLSHYGVEGQLLFTREPGAVYLPGNVEIGFFLMAYDDPQSIFNPWANLVSFFWENWGRSLFEKGFPVKGSLEPFVEHTYNWAFENWKETVWQEFEVDNQLVGAPVFIVNVTQSPNYPGEVNEREFRSIWNQAWFSSLRSAQGLFRYARRTNNQELLRKAIMTKELALSFPQMDGFFHGVIATDMTEVEIGGNPYRRSKGWDNYRLINSNRNPITRDPFKSPFHILDMSWTCYLMLTWHEELEQDERLIDYAVRYADALLQIQTDEGFFPAWLSLDSLRPMEVLTASPETSMSVTFLLKLSEVTQNQRYFDAAIRGLEAVIKHIIPVGRWEDFEAYWSSSRFGILSDVHLNKKFERNNMFKQNNFSMYWTAEALYHAFMATNDKRYLDWGKRTMDELLMTQSTWEPPFMYVNTLGGFGVMNADGEWNDARQSLFSELIIQYGKELDDIAYIQRGLAALKASFVMMYCPENASTMEQYELAHPFFNEKDYGFMMENYGHNGLVAQDGTGIGVFTIYDWGNGAASEAYNRILDRYGEQFIYGQKKPLEIDDIGSWNRILETTISPNGQWVAYRIQSVEGNSSIYLYNKMGQRVFEAGRGQNLQITEDSKTLLFTFPSSGPLMGDAPQGIPGNEKLPDCLGIYHTESGQTDTIQGVKNHKTPENWSGWLAYQAKGPCVQEEQEDLEHLPVTLLGLANGESISWPNVSEYDFAKSQKKLSFISRGESDGLEPGIYIYDIKSGTLAAVMQGLYEYRRIAFSEEGDKLAFLLNDNGEHEPGGFDLYVWTETAGARKTAHNHSPGLPANWVISKNRSLFFSGNGNKIFFGATPLRPVRDPDIPDDEFPDVDIWHWNEGLLHTVQLANKEQELSRTYLAMADLSDGRYVQIETMDAPESKLFDKGNAGKAFLISGKPYELESMWGHMRHDYYLLDLVTGNRELIREGIRAHLQASPGNDYLIWFDYGDYSYYTFHIHSGREYRISHPDLIRADWETNTTHSWNEPYGVAGWLEGDKAVLIYDRYDIWMVDPQNKTAPRNVSRNGRDKQLVYRLIRFGKDNEAINGDEPQYLHGFHETSRTTGYYTWQMGHGSEPETLMEGPYRLSDPLRAREAATVVYTRETYHLFPDLLITDLTFRNNIRISDANPQQRDFFWGTAELYQWTSVEGRPLDGLLYKPENFDPTKKYPMIVQFFHKSSHELFHHRTLEYSRSRIDYPYYTSNGYVIFNPDIYFDPGYPGESAFKSVIPGITALIGEGFIDPERIGVQGHSYSGYQAAYLATRTNIFACIQAGAPVVNFFSAYGGIRWESGRSRVFQYENDQTLASIWEAPLRYLENSPLFFMDKVTAPVLIMHNDQDGAVPWYQGIEFFIALRRLKKPAWLLNYPGELHSVRQYKNRKDFQLRMAQFFAHYLKEEPMPKWMHTGIPAVDKDHELGYELLY